jgi:predicted molibdopterin-dependent oxidoreductase YjgC
LRIKPGSESHLFGLVAKLLLDRYEKKGKPHIEGIDDFAQSLEKLRVSDSLKLTGVDESSLKQVSSILADGKNSVILIGAGIAQSPPDTNNAAVIQNLAQVCRAKLMPLGLGCNDRGLYELNDSSSENEITKDEILQSVSDGSIKGLYLVGAAAIPKGKNPEFLVVQSSFFDKNSEKADVFLPATTFAETEGVYVNVEGRIQMSQRAIDPLGEAKPDWWIFSELARRMKAKGFDYKKPADILKEIRKVFPRFANATSSRLENRNDVFIKERQKGPVRISPMAFEPLAGDVAKKYPFRLILKLDPNCYRNLSLSSENRGFALLHNSRWIRMNPEDAEKRGYKNDDPLVLESSSGRMEGVLKVSETLPQGVVESRFIWNEDPSISGFDLVFPLSKGYYPQGPIPVKVKRGK